MPDNFAAGLFYQARDKLQFNGPNSVTKITYVVIQQKTAYSLLKHIFNLLELANILLCSVKKQMKTYILHSSNHLLPRMKEKIVACCEK